MKSSCLAKFPAALALLLACPAHRRRPWSGAFPQYGFDVQTGGVYYEVSGVAVRY